MLFAKKLKALIKFLKPKNADPASPPACKLMERIQWDVQEMVCRAMVDCQNRPHDRRPRTARLIVVFTPIAGQPDEVDANIDARYQPPTDVMPAGRRPGFQDRSAN